MEELNLVKVCEATNEHEALMMQSALEGEGIKTMVTGLTASALGDALDGADAIDLLVKVEELERAKEIVAEFGSEEEEVIPAWVCKCGEQVDEGFFVCWSCQAEYEGPSEKKSPDPFKE